VDGFRQLFGMDPAVQVRAPGRVNLIGEHTDYSLLPVLPLAMDRATRVTGAVTDDGRLQVHSRQFGGDADLAWPGLQVREPWHRYVAGVAAVLGERTAAQGARLWIDSDLPSTGGLSSSSAFTMGLLAALNHLWHLGLAPGALVDRAIVAERHVGVESGGMDQTVIAHAQEGAALRIDFDPPSTRPVPLPPELHVVVAYSGAEAPKGGAVRQAYNDRVIGCRLAAAMLGAAGDPPVLGAVADAPAGEVERLPDAASAEAVARRAGIDVGPLVRLTAGRFNQRAPVRVRAVARHVLDEARRVDQAERALVAVDLDRLGQLLDQSHHSLAQDFRCSTDGLDRLCRVARETGALGARLTGAGFGGYALAAVTSDRLDAVMRALGEAGPGPVFETRASGGLKVMG